MTDPCGRRNTAFEVAGFAGLETMIAVHESGHALAEIAHGRSERELILYAEDKPVRGRAGICRPDWDAWPYGPVRDLQMHILDLAGHAATLACGFPLDQQLSPDFQCPDPDFTRACWVP